MLPKQNSGETNRTLAAYLNETLGINVVFEPWNEAIRLPPYLRERYSFFQMDLLGFPCVLMVDLGTERNTPAAIGKHRQQVAARWNGGILYAAQTLSATDRARLVAVKVPFLIPGRQLYLPPLGIDFRERFSSAGASSGYLSPVAQLIVLGVMLGKKWADSTPTDLAKRLGYTKMTIGRAFGEISAAGLATIRSAGRAKRFSFVATGKDLWRSALPRLRSPVKAVAEYPAQIEESNVFISGLSALSDYTNLAPPEYTIFAVRSLGTTRAAASQPEREPAGKALLERWAYNPVFLAEGHRVDRLSLYLSLYGASDERVEKALDELLEGVPW
jgi:DNA-binding MarR family transcriptional regulator